MPTADAYATFTLQTGRAIVDARIFQDDRGAYSPTPRLAHFELEAPAGARLRDIAGRIAAALRRDHAVAPHTRIAVRTETVTGLWCAKQANEGAPLE